MLGNHLEWATSSDPLGTDENALQLENSLNSFSLMTNSPIRKPIHPVKSCVGRHEMGRIVSV